MPIRNKKLMYMYRESYISAHMLLNLANKLVIEPGHEISINVVCATGKASDQTAHTRSLIRAFASRLNIFRV